MSTFTSTIIFGSLALLVTQCASQRTPTITYISPPIVTRIGGTIEMDCSAIYATEYPILWVKLPSGCKIEREAFTNNIRSIISDNCTPIPLSSGSALIIRDNRFRWLENYQPLKQISFWTDSFTLAAGLAINISLFFNWWAEQPEGQRFVCPWLESNLDP